MSNLSLYEITAEQKELVNQIIEAEGELTPELEQALILTEANKNKKSIAYLEVLSAKKMMNAMIDDEIKRLQAFKKRNNSVIDRLEENLLLAIKTFGDYIIGTKTFGTRKSSVLIVDADAEIPEIYQTKKLVITPDKMALKKAILAGEIIEGVYIQENQNLKLS